MKLSVIIAVYNEVGTLEETIHRVESVRLPKEIIVVEDGSTDGTRELLKRLQTETQPGDDPLNELKVLFQEKNQGKGAAIRAALPHVTGDVVVIQDADLEYDPQDYMKLLEPMLLGKADVVYGTRFYGGGPHRVLLFWHYLGNQMLTLLSNFLTNLNLTDMEVGYKVFKAEVLKKIELKSNRFGFEPEITLKVARRRCRVYEVPISYHGRTYAEGKKITWKDGVATFYFLIRFWLKD